VLTDHGGRRNVTLENAPWAQSLILGISPIIQCIHAGKHGYIYDI
jgi:hypothetical protein